MGRQDLFCKTDSDMETSLMEVHICNAMSNALIQYESRWLVLDDVMWYDMIWYTR